MMNYKIIIKLYMIHFLAGYAKFPVNAKNVKNKMTQKKRCQIKLIKLMNIKN